MNKQWIAEYEQLQRRTTGLTWPNPWNFLLEGQTLLQMTDTFYMKKRKCFITGGVGGMIQNFINQYAQEAKGITEASARLICEALKQEYFLALHIAVLLFI